MAGRARLQRRHGWRSLLGRRLGLAIAAFALLLNSAIASLPAHALTVDRATELWRGSAHALQEVNCSSCHQPEQTETFVVHPDLESCRSCHEAATETFLFGKHGIRLLEGQTPLTPAMARLPMKLDSLDRVMNCNTCHEVHRLDTRTAAVDSCLTCHNDPHSLAYVNSKHAGLLAGHESLPRPSGGEVTCATCHLPRYRHSGQVAVNHNNTFTLKPRDRMVSEVCMNCHGMEFAYNNIFDDEVVEANFARASSQDLKTLQMVRQQRDSRTSFTRDSGRSPNPS
ncbi:cytochrome c3 family protein [Synechococcus sp. PCC 7336]|uniref:cytochrome c3 family protein n=1 Tax=Synechococcus sp. PCC 7336 TaxID=195250 RepID=UPI000349A711|nr:cytochrome c3 family protein [Synechococcus sp. PCC 7336]